MFDSIKFIFWVDSFDWLKFDIMKKSSDGSAINHVHIDSYTLVYQIKNWYLQFCHKQGVCDRNDEAPLNFLQMCGQVQMRMTS